MKDIDFNVDTSLGKLSKNRSGFNFLDIPENIVNKSGNDFFKSYNEPWLNAAMKRGDNVVLATKSKFKEYLINPDRSLAGNFAKEIEYLVKMDFKPININDSE